MGQKDSDFKQNYKAKCIKFLFFNLLSYCHLKTKKNGREEATKRPQILFLKGGTFPLKFRVTLKSLQLGDD